MVMEERRRGKRVRVVSQLEVETPAAPLPINAFTTNLSRTGAGFCTGKRVEIGSEVKIRIFFDHSPKDQISEIVTGRICWVKQVSRIYEAGVEFATLNRAQHSNLLKTVGELS